MVKPSDVAEELEKLSKLPRHRWLKLGGSFGVLAVVSLLWSGLAAFVQEKAKYAATPAQAALPAPAAITPAQRNEATPPQESRKADLTASPSTTSPQLVREVAQATSLSQLALPLAVEPAAVPPSRARAAAPQLEASSASPTSQVATGAASATRESLHEVGSVEVPVDAAWRFEALQKNPISKLRRSIGAQCTTDTDCPDRRLKCFTSLLAPYEEGVVQGGYCSMQCKETSTCGEVDNLAACNPNLQLCMGLCLHGDSELDCQDTNAQACRGLTDHLGVCIPACTHDAACGSGRFCHPGTGLCVTTRPRGKRIGDACDAAQGGRECASGVCLEARDSASSAASARAFCSGTCILGSRLGCGYDGDPRSIRQAACWAPAQEGGKLGDEGYCIPLCDTVRDCSQPNGGWVCEHFEPAVARDFGRRGRCVPGGRVPARG
jgi:hypothetical protein